MKNMKLSTKLYTAFGILTIILLVLGLREYLVLNEIALKKDNLEQSFILSDAAMEAKYVMRSDMQMIMEMIEVDNLEGLEEQMNEHNLLIKEYDKNMQTLLTVCGNKEWGVEFASNKLEVIKATSATDEIHDAHIGPIFERMYQIKKQILGNDTTNSDVSTMMALQGEIDEEFDAKATIIVEGLENIEIKVAVISDSALKLITEASDQAILEATILTLTGLLIAIILSYVIIISINRQLGGDPSEVFEIATLIAKGDLTFKFDDTRKPIGVYEAMKQMSNKLVEIINAVKGSSDQIGNASLEMSSSSQQMSEGATEQASSAEEISSSMEEMVANIQQNTDNAKQTEKIAESASGEIQSGSSAVNETVDSMKTIATKISIIGEISRQTNLLALNAAVEAARAGEHGKGFAVVAAEVRKLAERSQLAATEIDELSATSVDVAQKSGTLLKDIVPNIQKTADLVQEITAASIEQNTGADQINNAIQQLNEIVQQNAATAEELAASSEELNSQAEYLTDLMGFFVTNNDNHSKTTTKKKEVVKTTKATVKTVASTRNGVEYASGVNIDLNSSGGRDSKDSEYEKF